MAADFSHPQRQSQIGIIVMFLDTVRHFVGFLWPILAIWIFKPRGINSYYVMLAAVVIFLIISITAYLKYLNFTFYLDDGNEEFIINEGIFNKTKTAVRLDKIQQVNITQSLLQRIIGVYALEIDTAGSNKEEGNIKAVSHTLALALKARLLENDKEKVAVSGETEFHNEAAASEDRPFMQISLLSLFKVSITSNYVRSFWLMFAFSGTVYDFVLHLIRNDALNEKKINSYFNAGLAITSIFILIIALFVVLFIVNVFRIVVRYFGFKITRQSGSLLLSFGLINTKSTIIKPEKVQIITVTQNYFQKKMNILGLQIKQATGGEKEERHQAIEIPGCNETERDAILKLLFHTIPEKGAVMKPNFRKLGFSIFLIIVVPLSGFFAVAHWAEPKFYEFSYLAGIYALLTLIVLWFGFRNYRLFINDRFIIKQSGAWDISNEIVEPGKIQAITTSQLFWHKHPDIGYLTLHTAGGKLSFQLGNFTKIKHYVNLWLYEMESSDSNWM